MRRLLGLVVALATTTLLVGACGVNDSGNAERITPGLGLDDTAPTTSTTTTTTTTTTAPTASTTETTASTTTTTLVQTEPVQLWFISGTQLNYVTPSMPYPASLDQVLAALQELGPPAATLRTAVPASPRLTVMDNGDGTATVELPIDFFGTIPNPDQRLAIGQIVLTLTLRPGIGGVRFRSGGDDFAVILGNGEQSGKGQTVTRRDYATLTGEAPPSTTSTTTTTAAPEVAVPETTVAP